MQAFISGLGAIFNTQWQQGKIIVQEQKNFFQKIAKNILPKRERFGRMDKYSQASLLALGLALKDAKLEDYENLNIGIIASTQYGSLERDIDFLNTVKPKNGLLASPKLFTYTLPSTFLGEAALNFNLKGETFVINETKTSGLEAIKMALLSPDPITLLGKCDFGTIYQKEKQNMALFFVLEKKIRNSIHYYGTLRLNNQGLIDFNKQKVENFISIFKAINKN